MATPTWADKHNRNLVTYQKRIKALFERTVREIAALTPLLPDLETGQKLDLSRYPVLNNRIDKLMEMLNRSMYGVVVNGVETEWTLANNKNSELARMVFGDNIGKLTKEQYARYFSTNGKAMDAFLMRKESGMNLSERVWHYVGQWKKELELGLEVGIHSGLSASRMASQLKQYLNNPDALFRRVRDEEGNLRLSEAASLYHPGQGVYRSAYKNSLRLTVTETNIAYHTADHLRVQEFDFVVGIDIRLSSNHTTTDSKGRIVELHDICDELKGRYPKDFKFVGWHPFCRCQAITILKTPEEMERDNKRMLAGQEPLQTSSKEVRNMPRQFDEWIKDNEERLARAKNLPYFVSDNEQYVYPILES